MWQVKYGLCGAFGGFRKCEWEDTDCDTEEKARNYAYELACREYGDKFEIFNEDHPSFAEYELAELYNENMENSVAYIVREI